MIIMSEYENYKSRFNRIYEGEIPIEAVMRSSVCIVYMLLKLLFSIFFYAFHYAVFHLFFVQKNKADSLPR